MKYPTLEQVESADRMQLAEWQRFLDSPGMSALDFHTTEVFEETLKSESAIAARIAERFKEAGGMSPAISKSIGW